MGQTEMASAAGGAALVLVHCTAKKPMFAPVRVGTPVTYVGRLTSNDVVLASDNVSRRHAKLILTDLALTVHDLDSHNGVFVNGVKVRSKALVAGDLLYVGDVCLQVRTSEGDRIPLTTAVHEDITGEEDPSERNARTLLRAVQSAGIVDDHEFATSLLDLCRELSDAHVAVLLRARDDGVLETPVVQLAGPHKPDAEPPISWTVVRRCLEEGKALFSSDVAKRPIMPDDPLSAGDAGAMLCVPVLARDKGQHRSVAAIYLSRPQAGPTFTARELETVTAMATMLATRVRGSEGTLEVEDASLLEAQAARDSAEKRLHAAYGDLRTLTDRIHAVEAENEALKVAVDDSKHEHEHAAKLGTMSEELSNLREALDGREAVARLAVQAGRATVQDAVRAVAPSVIAEHVDAMLAGGALVTDAHVRPMTALYLSLLGFDGWAVRAAPADVKARADAFCSVVHDRAAAHGGRVEQVMGHGHLVVFDADAASVRAAVRCGVEVAARVPVDASGGVVAGMHTAPGISGFFGKKSDGHATWVEVGEAVLIARGAIDHATGPGIFYVTDAVRQLASGEPSIVLVNVGPNLIKGTSMPVMLHLVARADGGVG